MRIRITIIKKSKIGKKGIIMKKMVLLCVVVCVGQLCGMEPLEPECNIEQENQPWSQAIEYRQQQLKQQLEKSAFRRGISTGIQGTMKIAPSDHSPITVQFDDIFITSWNLLSDEHTWNFLFDVGRKKYFAEHKRDGRPIFWRDVFNDFGNFVLNNSEIDESGIHTIKISKKLMNDFITERKLHHQMLQESLVQNQKEKERSDNSLKDAEAFVNLVLDNKNPDHEDIKTSLIHIIEIKYSIDKGYLRWEERLKKLKENKFLVKNLAAHDFLCFQECTNPHDMLTLLQKNNHKHFDLLDYVVKAGSQDHCVIMYDKNKYALEDHINFGLADNKKPCIIAKFRSLKTNAPIIIGSIHHPGTGRSEMHSIIERANALLEGAKDIPVMILGDYNHASNFYKQDTIGTDFELKMPNIPTMAGFEYGNLNVAIDGVLTNRPDETMVDVLNQKTFASQVTLPIEIIFEI
jgi:exonuclease III